MAKLAGGMTVLEAALFSGPDRGRTCRQDGGGAGAAGARSAGKDPRGFGVVDAAVTMVFRCVGKKAYGSLALSILL